MSTAPDLVIPDHVPPALVKKYRLMAGETTYEDPFKTIIPAIHAEDGPILYGPMAWLGMENGWVFTREEDVRTIFMDTEHFSSEGFSPFSMLIGESWAVLPVEADPPMHRGFRNVLATELTPPKVAAMENQVREAARTYIDEFRNKSGCDAMADYAARLPIRVFLNLFGLPLDEVDQFMEWEFELLHSADPTRIAVAVSAVKKRILVEMHDRKKNPKEDLISHIVHSDHEGRPLTEDEAFGICFNLYLGGLDTVTTNMAWQLRHLANDIELQEKLRADESLIPLAIEEMLRAYASVAISRTCIKQTKVAGVTLMPGDRIMMSTSLASNDPAFFENPTVIDINRKQRHLAFGTGVHNCVGVRLARREMVIALEEFLRAIPTFRLAPDAKIRTHLSNVMYQESVPLVW
jgi:cytochrome P450